MRVPILNFEMTYIEVRMILTRRPTAGDRLSDISSIWNCEFLIENRIFNR